MMNGFDLAVLVLLLLAFFDGYRRGAIRMLAGLATVVLAAIFGGKLAEKMLPQLQKLLDCSTEAANVLSYVAAFLAIAFVLGLVGRAVQKLFESVNLSFVNRILGSVISMGTAAVVLSILLNLLLIFDSGQKIIKPALKEKSFFYERIRAVIPAAVPYFDRKAWEEYVPEKYRRQIENFEEEERGSEKGNPIDSSFQKRHFETGSV